MRNFFATFLLLLTFSAFAQNEQLAANYFEKGDFEKALVSYEELLSKQPGNANYFQKQSNVTKNCRSLKKHKL